MKYTDYLAQQAQRPQETQEEPQTQPAQSLEQISAQMAAEKYYSLQAEAREAIKTEPEPSALAAILTAAIFGDESPEAETVAEAIKRTQRPGGYDYAITMAEQRKTQLKRQLKRLANMQKELTLQAEEAEAEEWQLRAKASDAGQANAAILAVMTLARAAEEADAETILLQAGKVCEKHSNNRPAMGLLYGIVTDEYSRICASGAALDIMQQQAMEELIKRIGTAAGLG